jgi:acyl-CoA dehydrogenase
MKRTIFDPSHEAFRYAMRSLFAESATPFLREWAASGRMPGEFFSVLGDVGLFGIGVAEEYGGSGDQGYAYKVIAWEEAARAHVPISTARTHTDVVTPYFVKFADIGQKKVWLPKLVSGDCIAAIAITEPGSGSDVAGMRTRAERCDGGYLLKGSKTFVTGGIVADVVIVVARTGVAANRREGLSLLLVERGMPGFERSEPLRKLGQHSSDLAELYFDDVYVPAANLLGEEGSAFQYLSLNLPQERIAIAAGAVSMAQVAITETIEYVNNREMFGTRLSAMQNTKFVLASLSTKAHAAQAMLDAAVTELDEGTLSAADAARVKMFCSEVQGEVVDSCLQLHGGLGYMAEASIAQMYVDARVSRIYGGSTEVMKVIIARDLGLGPRRGAVPQEDR